MALYIHLSNLVINKATVDIDTVKKQLRFGAAEYDQEDEFLLSIARMNASEFDIGDLTNIGLTEKDFVVVTRYGGKYWEADWLNCFADFYCWHSAEDGKIFPRVQILDEISVDQFIAKYESPLVFLQELNR